MSMRMICGIDAGYKTGGVALLSGPWAEVHDLPTYSAQGVDCTALMDILRSVEIDFCVIEKQGSMPRQGIASAFKLGMGYGQIIGCVSAAKIPYQLVAPHKWKRAMSVSADKDGARRQAQQLYPSVAGDLTLKKHEHRAEALLMAAYGEALNALDAT